MRAETAGCGAAASGAREAYIEPVSEYVVEAWTRALEPLGVRVHTSRAGAPARGLCFLYEDYDAYDFETRDARAQWVYSYVYRKALTRKNYLGNTIAYYRAKRPASILHRAWPDSFNLEVDFAEFLDDALDESWDLKQELAKGGKTWILKPALGERAHGIRLFRTQADLQAIMDETLDSGDDSGDDSGGDSGGDGNSGDHDSSSQSDAGEMRQYVVQEYVADPMLVRGKKFHLRVYCACVGRLRVFVQPRMLALFSGTDYDAADLADLRGHLTNTCFQGDAARVSLLEDEVPAAVATAVVDDVCRCVHDVFEAAAGDPINFQALPNAVEFFGLDFLLTADAQVKLLEVNAYPDFKQTGARLRGVVDGLFAETAALLFGGSASGGSAAPATLREVLDLTQPA